ncbi:MAG: hypothetical protein BWY74_03443 [Firmicutes bacterium ADurb.Bin419]|nr:MAG: hypothetical protein BWY74_03443 [Firmicutes bacterium ADurb.Bin419]
MSFLVNIYMDKKSNLLFIPTVYDMDGVCRDYNKPVILQNSNNFEEIGSNLKESFLVCKNGRINSREEIVKVFELTTGIKSYSKFSKDRFLVWAEMDQEFIYLTPCEKDSFGAYSPARKKAKKLSSTIENKILGEQVIEMFSLMKNL